MSAKEKKKFRFNIIDAAVIAVLAVLAAVFIATALAGLGVGDDDVTIRYVLETEILSNEYTSKVSVGDGVYTEDGAEKLGSVTAVSLSPARHTGVDADGAPVVSEIDGYSVIYITVEAKATPTPTGYAIGDTIINVGRENTLRLPSLYSAAHCVSVEEITEE